MDFDYIPISVSTLVPETNVGLDLFRQDEQSKRYSLYRGKDYPLSVSDLERLRNRGVNQLFISKEARWEFQGYLRGVAEGDSEAASLEARVHAMNDVVRDVLAASFDRKDTDETVTAVAELGSMAAEIVSNDEFAAADLFRVLHHDYATFTHSANAALYAAVLASELGFSTSEVEQVTTGGLLHDLGKLEIDDKILSKPGKLDEEEFREIQRHPTIGFRKLAHRRDLNEGQLMMVYQHHERIDGSGYPVGLTGDEIHPWAKLCAVVDVYEALTSHRPYRTPLPSAKALEVQSRDLGTAFDPEMLQCWMTITKRDLAS